MITLVALCAIGIEKILGNELKQLGYTLISNSPGRVMFSGDEYALYRTNLCLRTADRVYLCMAQFPAKEFDALFEGVKAIAWQDYFKRDVRVIVDKVRTHQSALSSEHSVQGVTHKAIYTKLGELWHMSTMPETGAEVNVRVYIEKDTALILLDLSGSPLHRRGYRTTGGEAPMRETLAASLLHLLFWRRKTPLHDPFCGSGTIAIEAALYAYNAAPGFGRNFAIEDLGIYDAEKAKKTYTDAALAVRPDCLARITGTDIDSQAIVRATANAERAGVIVGRALQSVGSDARIQRPDFAVADFADLCAPFETGLLLSNPPYGERLGDETEAENLYKNMSSLFKTFPQWAMAFITSSEKFEQCIGKQANRKKYLKSGNLDTYFYMYDSMCSGDAGLNRGSDFNGSIG